VRETTPFPALRSRLPVIAKVTGPGHRIETYEISDRQMSAGSTLGGPKATMWIKPTGAIEKFWSIEAGEVMFETLVLHHWDERTGIPLQAQQGEFLIHPDRQEHLFELANGVTVHEDLFVLSGKPQGEGLHEVDPPAAYYCVELTNDSESARRIATYASLQLRGSFAGEMRGDYDEERNAFVLHSSEQPHIVRYAACSVKPTSYEMTLDSAKANAQHFRGGLSNTCMSTEAADVTGVFHLSTSLRPGQKRAFAFMLTFALDGDDGTRAMPSLPSAQDALRRTRAYYDEVLGRAIVMTPDPEVNRGVLWAKANMLRIELLSPQGWAFTNDPTRSNNSVGRDTAWFAFGCDYTTPHFSRESLLWYADHLQADGMAVEYFDIRTGESNTDRLNVNDDTPLLILAFWHHYNTTGDRTFLEYVYPKAVRMADYILSQRNGEGLVWCTATGTNVWGIVGWRNVIDNYRLSGATTELNSECYAALKTMSLMADELGEASDRTRYQSAASELRSAINEHLLDRSRGIYYLNIDVDGTKRTDVTADLVFPVMFGVADHDTAARIISRLSVPEFWSEAGIHTVPRTSIMYGPTHGFGLLGGIWVGVTFWFAFAAAPFNPEFMAEALAASFKHYSRDPRRTNTVPGQFSEWLHGETLVNQGMMLSPWFPPRYVWAAVEGAAGLDLSGRKPDLAPRLTHAWKWLAVRNLPLRGGHVSWFAARLDDLKVFASYPFDSVAEQHRYEEDVSSGLHVTGEEAVVIGLARRDRMVMLVGNTLDRTVTTALSLDHPQLEKLPKLRLYNSLRSEWLDVPEYRPDDLRIGYPIQIDRHGFCLLELSTEE
jgi:glycogen debranching enzyme